MAAVRTNFAFAASRRRREAEAVNTQLLRDLEREFLREAARDAA